MNCKINKQEAKVKYDGIECCYINIKNINFSQSTVTKEGDQYYLKIRIHYNLFLNVIMKKKKKKKKKRNPKNKKKEKNKKKNKKKK